jgi:hypothetical protein
MNYSFSKAKLPKGASYPLKRSALNAALTRANINDLVYVSYLKSQRSNELMRATYHGDHRRDYYASGKTSLSVYSVPSDERAVTESAILNGGLDALVGWLKKCETAQNTWRAKNHNFILVFSPLKSLVGSET